ncbi:hypothetical protein Zmor_020730 [Zophobas morio]|uniref:Doublesex dimerisation domain-containing protein n=1 Tax=Zophobas morio TaxID=2755281 RepID=A0AA38M9X9_9CUCU|nr:hypothetical protein Zmor_020730 [Zophobas morio]
MTFLGMLSIGLKVVTAFVQSWTGTFAPANGKTRISLMRSHLFCCAARQLSYFFMSEEGSAQSTDLLEDCQKLLERFKYPWEMMPLMYAILKDARADLEEASRRIDEGRDAEILLDFCQRLKDKFQLSWKMISLVDVILKYAKDQDEAWRQIDEAFLEIRALAAVEAARYTYHHIPYTGLYSNAAAAIYPPVYLPSMSMYHPATLLGSVPPNTSPSHSPPIAPTAIRPSSRA